MIGKRLCSREPKPADWWAGRSGLAVRQGKLVKAVFFVLSQGENRFIGERVGGWSGCGRDEIRLSCTQAEKGDSQETMHGQKKAEQARHMTSPDEVDSSLATGSKLNQEGIWAREIKGV